MASVTRIDSPIRILHVGADTSGGVLNYIKSLTRSFDQNDFKTFVMVPEVVGDGNEVNYIIFDLRYNVFNILYKFYELKRLLKIYQIDLIHAHTLRAGFFIAFSSYFDANIKYIYTGHGLRFTQKIHALQKALFLCLELLAIKRSKFAVFIRQYDLNIMRKYSDKASSKYQFIATRIGRPTPKTNEPIQNGERRNSIMMAGALIDIKNPFFFVEVAKIYTARHPDSKFVWVGDGELRNQLENEIRRLNLEQRIALLGHMEHERAIAYLKKARNLFITSNIEVMPLILLEAYSVLTPVVTARFLGIDEVAQDGVTALIYEQNDTKSAMNKLEELNDEDLAQKLALNGWRLFKNEHLDESLMGNAYAKLYKRMLCH